MEREVASVPAEVAVEAQLCFIDKVVEVDGCCSRCGSSNELTTIQWCSYIQTRACPFVKMFGSGFCCIRSSNSLAAGCILLTNSVGKLLGDMFEGGVQCCSSTRAHSAFCDMWLALLLGVRQQLSCRSAQRLTQKGTSERAWKSLSGTCFQCDGIM